MPEADEPEHPCPQPRRRRFQFGLRSMFVVMTTFAVLFSLLKTFGVQGLATRLCAIGFLTSPIVWPLVWFYRRCKSEDVW